jgi:hypothetical protein
VKVTEIDFAAARALAEAHLRAPSPWQYPNSPDPADFVILDERTLELPYGWVFFYDWRRHVETGAFEDSLAGNAPVLVTRDGAVHETGTAYPLDRYLANFERVGRTYPDQAT